MSTPRAERLRGRLTINPDEVPAPTPPPVVAVPVPAPDPEPEPAPDPGPAPTAQSAATARPRAKRAKPAPPAVVSAVDDPEIHAGKKDYRSFYVDDPTFARWRAAIYWTGRTPEVAAEYGDNMSAAVERWMEATASDLEARFNHGEVFQMPPGTRRRKRKTGE